MNAQLEVLVERQKTRRHPGEAWSGNRAQGPCALGSGCPGQVRGRSLSRAPGHLAPGQVRTLRVGVGDSVSGRDRPRGESVQGRGSERGRRGGGKREQWEGCRAGVGGMQGAVGGVRSEGEKGAVTGREEVREFSAPAARRLAGGPAR